MTKTYEFDEAFQKKVVAMMLRDEAFASRVEGLVAPEYFDNDGLGYLANLCAQHQARYRQIPTGPIVLNEIRKAKAAKLIKPEFVDDLKPILAHIYGTPDLSNRDYTAEAVAVFARERALEKALLDTADLVENGGDVADARKILARALDVGSNDMQGLMDVCDDVAARISQRAAMSSTSAIALHAGITTGHKELDDALYWKGWGRGELYSLMGGPKSGKSIGLQHFAVNAAKAGHNVLFVTLENSSRITGDRMDAHLADVKVKELDIHPGKIRDAWKKFKDEGGGILKVVEFPMYTTKVSDIRRLLRRFQSQSILFDLIVVDYADLLAAEIRHEEKRHNSEEVYANLRNLAKEENAACLTATQTNREGAKANTAKKTDVAEDINKARLVDGLITINADADEKARGMMRLWFAASRNAEDEFGFNCQQDRSKMHFIVGHPSRY